MFAVGAEACSAQQERLWSRVTMAASMDRSIGCADTGMIHLVSLLTFIFRLSPPSSFRKDEANERLECISSCAYFCSRSKEDELQIKEKYLRLQLITDNSFPFPHVAKIHFPEPSPSSPLYAKLLLGPLSHPCAKIQSSLVIS